jgi:hypothetical protein
VQGPICGRSRVDPLDSSLRAAIEHIIEKPTIAPLRIDRLENGVIRFVPDIAFLITRCLVDECDPGISGVVGIHRAGDPPENPFVSARHPELCTVIGWRKPLTFGPNQFWMLFHLLPMFSGCHRHP